MDKYSKTLGFGLKICGVPKTNNHFHTPKQVRMVLPEKKDIYAYKCSMCAIRCSVYYK